MRHIFLAVIAALLFGCDSKPKENPSTSEEAWRAAAAKLETAIKPGMTQKEVLAVAGQPTEQKTIISGDVAEVWHYEVTPRVYLKVQFNRNGRVINTQLDSTYKTGG